MKRSSSKGPDPWPWLFFSLFLGFVTGPFAVTLSLDLSARNGIPWAFLAAPAVLACVLLPLAGAVGDYFKNKGRWVAFWGALLYLVVLLSFILDSFLGFWLFLAVLVFLLANAAHKSLLVPFPIRGKLWMAGTGLGLGALTWVPLFLLRPFTTQAPAFHSTVLVMSFTAAAVTWVLYYLAIPKDERFNFQSQLPELARETGDILKQEALFPGNLRFLFFLVFLAAGGALLVNFQATALGLMAPMAYSGEAATITALAAIAWGGLATKKFSLSFGLKRSLTLTVMIFMALIWAVRIAVSLTGLVLTSLVLLFFLGLALAACESLWASMLSRRREGAGFGLFYSALLLGMGLGIWVISAGWERPSTVFVCLLVALVSLQWLHPRGLKPAFSVLDDEPLVGTLDWDWQWGVRSLSGKARHGFFSKTMQMLARCLAEVFFGKIRIRGRRNLRLDGGAILVANHPNTFLDPLLITAMAPGRLHYWAKSTLWKLPFLGSILDRLGAIPIYRRQDYRQQERPGNEQTMGAASQKLNQGAHILIFPEGVSATGLSLKPVKTGAARLGFQALEENAWSAEIPIVPIALDYAEPSLFRTHVTIRIGDPIWLSAFHDRFLADARAAVLDVTARVSERLKNQLPHLDNPELENLVRQIHQLYGERISQILGEDDETAARKAISEAVNHYHQMDPATLFLFSQRMDSFYREQARLSTPENHPPIPLRDILKILAGLFSFASFGLIANWPPYRLTGWVVDWFSGAPVWRATTKLILGGLMFLLYYAFLGLALYHLAGPLISGFVMLIMILSAFMALGSLDRFAFRFRQLRTLWQAFWTQDTNDDMEAMKVSLIQDLERFRESYAFYKAQEDLSW